MHGTEAIIPLKNESVPVQITADSTIGQTLVGLQSVMESLLNNQRVSTEILQRIENSTRNTAQSSEKTARLAAS